MKENIQQSLDYLADVCLEEAGNYEQYTDKDLFNATEIFMHIFVAKTFEYQKNKVSQKQLIKLASEAGKSIRQTILLATGKYMPKVVKELLK